MPTLSLRAILAALALALPGAAPAAPPAAAAGHSCHLPGAEEALRCLRLEVPLDHAQAAGSRLRLHVTIAPALRETALRDPLFILAGGLGEAGSEVLPMLASAFRKVRATRDVVLIDQRGTGLSGKLECKSGPEDDNLGDAAALASARACLQRLAAPYAHYGTDAAAQDIEAVRRALGYAQINLWGGSYGTRLAQHYARRYPAQVRSLILDGVAAPGQIIPAGGRDAQAALDTLFRQCAADAGCAKAFPELPRQFASLRARLAQAPLQLELPDPRTAELRAVEISSARFLGTVHNILYSQQDSRRLPFLIDSAARGRWQPFLARSNVARDFASDAGPALGLHLAVVCAEDYPRLTPAVLAEDTRASFLGPAQIGRAGQLCPLLGVPAVAPAAPTPIAAPVLMLSGALDPVTPPRRAEAAGRHLQRAQHLIVQNGGHIVSPLGCVPRLLREFLDQPGQPLHAACLREIPAPTFQLNSAGPQP
ncbi:alpha/beta hydrolase [Massilia sp. MB5]|uniref:alpha/beta hydrolase n=1 Tax=Massilia sp. MB5 TaxID=2919578 RepID=UPI001F0F4104|nr:alpha/beta fold hydrolase [Massilia sp. MB5]UMR32662.1 alpha/beta hydrolase [Massilia sp. MB5]